MISWILPLGLWDGTAAAVSTPEPFGRKAVQLFGQSARHEPLEGQATESRSLLGQSAIFKEIE